jgi:outer membrane lipoprotein-sorting protein
MIMKLLLLVVLSTVLPVSASTFLPSSFKAVLEQQHVSELSGKVKKTPGVLEYKYPGMLRFELNDSQKSIFVSNKKKSWYYTPPFKAGEKGNVRVQSSENLFLTRFFDALKKGLTSNKLYDVKKKKSEIEIIFKDNVQNSLGLKKAIFKNVKNPNGVKSFSELKKMVLVRSDSKEVTLVFKQFDEKAKFKKSHFVFSVPENTKVIVVR